MDKRPILVAACLVVLLPGKGRGEDAKPWDPALGTATITGTVKFFNSEKGYGFISVAGGEDVFVHYSNIEGEGYRSLDEGQRVEYDVGPGKKGEEAQNVRVSEGDILLIGTGRDARRAEHGPWSPFTTGLAGLHPHPHQPLGPPLFGLIGQVVELAAGELGAAR